MVLNTKFYIFFLLCCCALFVCSCTKDYFVSESNVRLYVPQLVSGEIQNLSFVFHGSEGEFLVRKDITSREIQQLSDNTIKMSIPVNSISGSPVVITCISDFGGDHINSGADFFSSRISSFQNSDNINCFSPTLDYRFYRYRKVVKPLGVEQNRVDTLNVDSDHLHKGKIDLHFTSLPTQVHHARIRYYGLGSSLDFYGEYKSSPSHYKEQLLILSKESISQSISGYFMPSIGEYCASNTHHGDQLPSDSPNRLTPISTDNYMDLEIDFLGSNSELLGHYKLSEDPNPPTISNPDNTATLPADQIILKSQSRLRFDFDGFLLVQFELVGWGEIIDGETTPM